MSVNRRSFLKGGLAAGSLSLVGCNVVAAADNTRRMSPATSNDPEDYQTPRTPYLQPDNPTSLIHVVLRGARETNAECRRNWLAMPNFDWKLDDEQIVALLTEPGATTPRRWTAAASRTCVRRPAFRPKKPRSSGKA